MIRLQRVIKKIPVQLRLWVKWFSFVICIVVLVLTLTEINQRLLTDSMISNEFYGTWHAFREFLVEGKNPYDVEMQDSILKGAEKLTIVVAEKSSFLKQPLFGIIFYLPFLFIRNFDIAFSWWLTLLEVGGVLIALLGVSLIKRNIRKNIFYVVFSILIMLGSLFFFSGIQKGTPAIFAFLILLLSVKALQQNGDELAGVLLAIMTIFPFYGWISMAFVLIWSLRQRRSKVFWWFLGTVILLGFAVALMEPQWFLYYMQMWVRYFNFIDINFIGILFESILPESFLLPWFFVGMMVLLLAIEWVLAGRSNFILFYWTLQLTFILEALLTVEISIVNLILLPVSIIFIMVAWEDRWNRKGRAVGIGIGLVSVILPWIINLIQPEHTHTQELMIIGILAFLLILNLYWIRWWLFRNVKLWFSDVYTLDQPGKNYGSQ